MNEQFLPGCGDKNCLLTDKVYIYIKGIKATIQ